MKWHQSFVPKLLGFTSQLLFRFLIFSFLGLSLQNFFRGKVTVWGGVVKRGRKLTRLGGSYCFEENGCLGGEKRDDFWDEKRGDFFGRKTGWFWG